MSFILFSGCTGGQDLFAQSVKKNAPKTKSAAPSVAPVSSQFIDPFGEVLTTKFKEPLYTYAKDTAVASKCYDDCAIAWPPFLVDYPEDVSGEYSTIKRTDDTLQVTFNGQPLYTYAPDPVNKVTGDGKDGVWDVVLVPVETEAEVAE
ncbi:hypothetical protein KA017_01060 [Candidatus Woesebacteria bacterium]|nr:hypothetical protein [Candidatus Woesebacteria bacterium]